MFAIYQKELKAYFRSFFGWLFLAVFSFLGGLYYFVNNLLNGNPYISATLQSLVVFLLFIMPLLTMRVFAEEKKLKTDQLLLTYPINLWSVVLGKFFALATLMLFVIAIFGIGTGIMCIYGTVPLADTFIAMLGFFLMGCVFIAVGMLLSTFTEHQIIAAILTYLVFIAEMIIPSILSYFFGPETVIMKLVSIVDFIEPFNLMFYSILDLTDVLYIISAIFVLLLLAYVVFGKNSTQIKAVGRNRYFAGVIVYLVIIALVIGLNIGASYIPKQYTNFDFTNDGLYTIGNETKDIINNLEDDITIYVIGDEDTIYPELKLYLNAYKSKHISVEYKPFDKYPNFASQYTDNDLSLSSLIIVKGDKSTIVDAQSLYTYEMNYQTYQYDMTGIDIEGQISSAITKLISDEEYTIYVTFGHGETPIYSDLEGVIAKGGYYIEDLYLLNYTEIPDDCACLIINGVESDFTAEEVKMVENYFNKGGKVIVSASLGFDPTPMYDLLIKKLTGYELTEGSVLENDYNNLYQFVPYTLVLNPEYNVITSNAYKDGKRCIFNLSRGLVELNDYPDNMYSEKLFITSDLAYSKFLNGETVVAQQDGDLAGVFALAVYSEKTNADDSIGKVCAFGTPVFVEEGWDGASAKANSSVFVGAINALCEKEYSSTIPAKSLNYEIISIPAVPQLLYAAIFVLLIPIICIASGIIIIIVRRKK